MSYKSIRIEVDHRVYNRLLAEQKTLEKYGTKKSLSSILLDFACEGMGIEQDVQQDDEQDVQEQDEQDVQEQDEQDVQQKDEQGVQDEQEQDEQDEQSEDVHAPKDKDDASVHVEQGTAKHTAKHEPYGLPEIDLQKERVLYIMDCRDLDLDELAQLLGVDAVDLAYDLSHDLDDDLEFSLLSKICKVFGNEFNPWWIRRGE